MTYVVRLQKRQRIQYPAPINFHFFLHKIALGLHQPSVLFAHRFSKRYQQTSSTKERKAIFN